MVLGAVIGALVMGVMDDGMSDLGIGIDHDRCHGEGLVLSPRSSSTFTTETGGEVRAAFGTGAPPSVRHLQFATF